MSIFINLKTKIIILDNTPGLYTENACLLYLCKQVDTVEKKVNKMKLIRQHAGVTWGEYTRYT